MEKCTERYQLSASKCFMHFSSILRHALMLLKNPQGSRLGVDHLTIEEGVDDFEKQILCMHTYTKNKMHTTTAKKNSCKFSELKKRMSHREKISCVHTSRGNYPHPSALCIFQVSLDMHLCYSKIHKDPG